MPPPVILRFARNDKRERQLGWSALTSTRLERLGVKSLHLVGCRHTSSIFLNHPNQPLELPRGERAIGEAFQKTIPFPRKPQTSIPEVHLHGPMSRGLSSSGLLSRRQLISALFSGGLEASITGPAAKAMCCSRAIFPPAMDFHWTERTPRHCGHRSIP